MGAGQIAAVRSVAHRVALVPLLIDEAVEQDRLTDLTQAGELVN